MIYRFGSFELDLLRVELRRDGSPCPLEPQVFALLAFLIDHRERMVSKDEIFEKVWDGRVVTDSALTSRIKLARKALGDDGKAQKFIKTIHGKGFRFVADIVVQRDESTVSSVDHRGRGGISEPGETIAAVDAGARPSIAVLPFLPIGDAGKYATIGDGLPHELITELARLRWLFVIARESSFRVREQNLDLREIGRLLGARYCLTGTIEIHRNRLVLTTELADTRGGDVVWSERYAGLVDDIHELRDEIRSSILTSLEIQIPLHEAAGARLANPNDLGAWSAYHLGLQHLYRFNQRDNAHAAALFERAITQDPDFARAHAGLSFVHFQTAFMRQTDDITGEIALARRFARRGLDIDPLDPFVNFTMGRSFWLEADLDRARAWLERATSLSPNYAQGIYSLAWTDAVAGNGVESRSLANLAMRLSPIDPLYYAMLGTRGLAHMVQGEDAEAVDWAERAARSPGAHVLIAMIAAAARAMAGDEGKARAWAAEVRERGPLLAREDFFRAFPIKPEPVRARVTAALRSLGF